MSFQFFIWKRVRDPVCKKVNLIPELAMKAQKGTYSSTLSLTSALHWGRLWTPRLGGSTPGKRPGTYNTGAWIDIKAVERVKSYRNNRWIVILRTSRRLKNCQTKFCKGNWRGCYQFLGTNIFLSGRKILLWIVYWCSYLFNEIETGTNLATF
jgi:hypothetical protein